jgi:bifunctional non-homologous end joining protein LigD
VRAALVLHGILTAVGLRGYVKTTGGKGVHVLVPLRPGPTHAEVIAYAAAIGDRMVASASELVTQAFARRDRGGRVYIDVARNVFGATLVAPYSVRHRAHAPVSTPLAWSELRPTLDPATLNVRTVPARLDTADPWRGFWSDPQSLPSLVNKNGMSGTTTLTLVDSLIKTHGPNITPSHSHLTLRPSW